MRFRFIDRITQLEPGKHIEAVKHLSGDERCLKKTLFRDIEAAELSSFSLLDVGAGSRCAEDPIGLRFIYGINYD